MKVEKLWQDKRENFLSRVSQVKDDKELIDIYQMLLEQLKTGIIGYYQHDVYLRQIIVLLFQEASQGSEILLTKSLPTLEFSSNSKQGKESLFIRILLNPILSYVILAGGFIFSILVGMKKMPFSGYCACFFAVGLALVIFQNIYKEKAKGKGALPVATSSIKIDNLDRFITRQTQLIDQHISDCEQLLEDLTEIPTDDTLNSDVKTLCQYVWAFANSGYPKESALYKAESILEKNDIAWVEYSPEKQSYYDIMPTKKESRIVYPALEKISDGTLVAKGQYLETVS